MVRVNKKIYMVFLLIFVIPGEVIEKVPTKLYSVESPLIALVGQNEARLKCFFAG